MPNSLKSSEVIDSISKKIELKKALRLAKKNNDLIAINNISQKIEKIDSKLQSSPLSKT